MRKPDKKQIKLNKHATGGEIKRIKKDHRNRIETSYIKEQLYKHLSRKEQKRKSDRNAQSINLISKAGK